jgi:biopolymer transport protein ExbD
MPETCPNPWYFGGCEPTIEYLWRWTDSWERWVLYALALTLAYVVVVAARVSHRYYSARRAEPVDTASNEFQRARKKLIADLSLRVQGLKSVAATAPYLGLLGTCVGILGMFHAIAMARSAVRAMEASEISAAPLSTAAVLIVAITATCFYNFCRTRIESLETQVDRKWRKRRPQSSQVAQSLSLAPRFSKLSFALVAVPVLALSVAGFMTFASFKVATGLRVGLAPDLCTSPVYDRVLVLHVTEANRVLINMEEEDWDKLAYRLSQIYSPRAERTLYLLADDTVPFQRVADAIDIVNSVPFTGTSEPLDIKVKLFTHAASTHCPEVWRIPLTYPKRAGNNPNDNVTSRSSPGISQ